MSKVIALHRAATVLWSPTYGEVRPIHRLQDLEAQVSAWQAYGHVATIHGQWTDGREVRFRAAGLWVGMVR